MSADDVFVTISGNNPADDVHVEIFEGSGGTGTGTGPKGDKGDTGDTGPPGADGAEGPPGADGSPGVGGIALDYDYTIWPGAGSDLTTTSTSFVDIDATNIPALSLDLVTGDVVELVLSAVFGESGIGDINIGIDWLVNRPISADTNLRGSLYAAQAISFDSDSNGREPATITCYYVADEDGTHTFKPQWKVDINTGHIILSSGSFNSPVFHSIKNLTTGASGGGGGSSFAPDQLVLTGADRTVTGTGAGNYLSFSTPFQVTVTTDGTNSVVIAITAMWGGDQASLNADFALYKDGTYVINWQAVVMNGNWHDGWIQHGSWHYVDITPSAGSHTYELKCAFSSGHVVSIGGHSGINVASSVISAFAAG